MRQLEAVAQTEESAPTAAHGLPGAGMLVRALQASSSATPQGMTEDEKIAGHHAYNAGLDKTRTENFDDRTVHIARGTVLQCL